MSKKYHIGMYGGKFMPFHKGHKYCLEKAMQECDIVYAILFSGGDDELRIFKASGDPDYLTENARIMQLFRLCSDLNKQYDSIVVPSIIDVSECKYADGSEDWDAETPLVRELLGSKLDAVYSSEYSYGNYFSKAYPEAEHILVDPPREVYPISGTKIREMKNEKEKKTWMV